MFCVNGNQIVITAGDTALMAILPKEDGYIPTKADRAIFTVRERPGRRAMMEKVLVPEEDGTVFIAFESGDTEKLGGKEYCWDIRYALDAETDESGNVVGWREMLTPMMGVGLMIVFH